VIERGHEELKELIAAYALGAVPQEEIGVIRDHSLSCEECMAEADGYVDATGALSLAVDPVELPAGFEERVLARVREDRTSPVPAGRLRRRWPLAPALAAGALVVALFAVLTAGLLDARSDLSQHEGILTALLHDGGIEVEGAGAVGRMVPTREGGVFAVTGLRKAPDAHTYQLWLIEDDEPRSAGTFDVREGISILETDHSLEGVDVVAVTIEPGDGSVQPTTDPILSSG
jgi:post-segregation antitoxin (ccd killing protein)